MLVMYSSLEKYDIPRMEEQFFRIFLREIQRSELYLYIFASTHN